MIARNVPALDIAYKLCVYDDKGRIKLSTSKETYLGRKQVFRTEREGIAIGDVIGCHDENVPGRPLLVQVMKYGQRISNKSLQLNEIRNYVLQEIQKLPLEIRGINSATIHYNVTISERLNHYKNEVKSKFLYNF